MIDFLLIPVYLPAGLRGVLVGFLACLDFATFSSCVQKKSLKHGIKLHSADTSRGSMTRASSTTASALYWCEKLDGVDETEDEILEMNPKTLAFAMIWPGYTGYEGQGCE